MISTNSGHRKQLGAKTSQDVCLSSWNLLCRYNTKINFWLTFCLHVLIRVCETIMFWVWRKPKNARTLPLCPSDVINTGFIKTCMTVFLPCIFIQLYLFTETMNMPTIFYFSALVHKPVLEHSLLCFLQVAFYYKSVGTVPTTKHQVHFNWTVTYYRNKFLFKKQSAGLNLLH